MTDLTPGGAHPAAQASTPIEGAGAGGFTHGSVGAGSSCPVQWAVNPLILRDCVKAPYR